MYLDVTGGWTGGIKNTDNISIAAQGSWGIGAGKASTYTTAAMDLTNVSTLHFRFKGPYHNDGNAQRITVVGAWTGTPAASGAATYRLSQNTDSWVDYDLDVLALSGTYHVGLYLESYMPGNPTDYAYLQQVEERY